MTALSEKQSVTESEHALFDRDLDDLPAELRWREWMGRIEAVLFASASPVPSEELQKLVGSTVSIDLLIDDIQAELKSRPYELVSVARGWMFRTKVRFADAIKAAADLGQPRTEFNEMEMAVLCAVAYHQPIDRSGMADIFGKEVSRDLIARLRYLKLIADGPRAPRRGAPHTFVTTPEFLVTFDLRSLRDLPELEIGSISS
ncbi:SMC-Scp complex subunit ScpB [Lentilitoribacter sp. EG35]|uniref:SMC-Scp complex subunit ScpB n=1 Tax=Lentilitoribacter sp. EG35 TaxID=3234192 RepID=UPI00345F412E